MGEWSEQFASWSREPQAWIVGAAVLFGIAVVLLLLAAVAAWRARRRARAAAPAAPATAVPDAGSRRLLAALVADPHEALAALAREDEPCVTAIGLLRAGVPVAAVARLTGIDAADLGDLVAARLGVLEPR